MTHAAEVTSRYKSPLFILFSFPPSPSKKNDSNFELHLILDQSCDDNASIIQVLLKILWAHETSYIGSILAHRSEIDKEEVILAVSGSS